MRLMTDTKEVVINGVKFTIGFVPRKTWMALESRQICALRMYKMDATLAAAGQNPSPEQLTKTTMEILKPEEIRNAEIELTGVHWDMIKHGVRGHAAEFPFVNDASGLVSDETISNYELNGFFSKLAHEVSAFNRPLPSDKKN